MRVSRNNVSYPFEEFNDINTELLEQHILSPLHLNCALGDGMPSIADIDEDNVSDPETTGSSTGHLDVNAKQLRKRFSDHLQTSGESNVPPYDLETLSETEDESVSYSVINKPQTNSKEDLQRARQLYAELKQMSNETGVGSIEDIIDNLATSTESMTSLIAPEKRQELNRCCTIFVYDRIKNQIICTTTLQTTILIYNMHNFSDLK